MAQILPYHLIDFVVRKNVTTTYREDDDYTRIIITLAVLTASLATPFLIYFARSYIVGAFFYLLGGFFYVLGCCYRWAARCCSRGYTDYEDYDRPPTKPKNNRPQAPRDQRGDSFRGNNRPAAAESATVNITVTGTDTLLASNNNE
jgi:hypothetical protein